MRHRLAIAFTVLVLISAQSVEATSIVPMSAEELKKYDLDGSGTIQSKTEQRLLLQHLKNPVMRAYDHYPMNGKLDPAEIIAIQENKVAKLSTPISENDEEEIAADLEVGSSTQIAFLAMAEVKEPPGSEKEQQIFLRQERINASVYQRELGRSASEGATIDIRYDPSGNASDIGFTGALSYVLRDIDPRGGAGYVPGHTYLSGYAVMPFLEFDYRKKSEAKEAERSKLIGGLSLQTILYDGPVFGTQVFQLNPSYQTDFDFDARIYSAQFAWQPYNVEIGLGSYIPVGFVSGVWLTWGLTLDADYRFVDEAGLTNLTDGSEYLWLGGVLDAKLKIAPNSALEDKIFATAKLAYHTDAVGGDDAMLFSTGISYNFDETGFTAINLTYQTGTDYQTGVDSDEIHLGLGVKF
ncbi:hypothetical protein [Ciceribacter selenitireducens]